MVLPILLDNLYNFNLEDLNDFADTLGIYRHFKEPWRVVIAEISEDPLGAVALNSPDIYNCIAMNTKFIENLEPSIKLDSLLGCGSYGCAYQTDSPEWTAKISIDKEEIGFYEFCRQSHSEFLPEILDIIELERVPARPLAHQKLDKAFVVYREAVSSALDFADISYNDRLDYTLLEQMGFNLENYYNFNKFEYMSPEKFIENQVSAFSSLEISELARSLLYWCLQKGVVVKDIRMPNIGYSVVDGRPILFDAQIIMPEKQLNYLAKMNF